MNNAAAPNQTKASLQAAMLTALEQLLRTELEHHQALLKCIHEKREAIRTADIQRVTSICAEENKIVQRMATSEKQRVQLIVQFTKMVHGPGRDLMTVSEMANMAAQPQQSHLQALAAQLHDTLTQVQRQSSILRVAAESLCRHMNGVVQTVHSALSRAGVYGGKGRINLGVQLRSSFDIKS